MTTSSTITTSSFGWTGPSTKRLVPCPLASLRTKKPFSGRFRDSGQSDHGGGDRIGPDRHPADGLRQRLAQQLQNAGGDQPGADRVERHLFAVEVVAGLLARGERELAEPQRFVADQLR